MIAECIALGIRGATPPGHIEHLALCTAMMVLVQGNTWPSTHVILPAVPRVYYLGGLSLAHWCAAVLFVTAHRVVWDTQLFLSAEERSIARTVKRSLKASWNAKVIGATFYWVADQLHVVLARELARVETLHSALGGVVTFARGGVKDRGAARTKDRMVCGQSVSLTVVVPEAGQRVRHFVTRRVADAGRLAHCGTAQRLRKNYV